MRATEPISDNKIRWIDDDNWITLLKEDKKFAEGNYGEVYRCGFRDAVLGEELGMNRIVRYVAKKVKHQEGVS